MTIASDATIGTFRKEFGGEVMVPGDAGYDDARSIWNGDIDRRPSVIARCTTSEHVAAAINFARQAGLELSVRGGGHNFAGHALSGGGLTIDLTGMRWVEVDAGAKRARCGGGATWADLDSATQAHGLAVTGGFISHTGVAGLTLGGGMGWLTRKCGLSCDNLVSVEIVTADGTVRTASEDENADLFWAVRGGGGNFGVVTTFEFALHEVGPLVNLGLFFWTADRGTEALRYARDFMGSLPDGVGGLIGCLSAPPAPFVPEEYHFAPGYALLLASWGTPEEHEALVGRIRTELTPTFEMVTPIPYVELQKMQDESAPWGILGYEKALYLDDLTDEVIAVMVEHFPRRSSPMSFVPIFPLTGAYLDKSDEDTAFGGARQSIYAFNIAAIAPTRDLFEVDREWVRSFWDALRPHASTSGGYVNFLSDAGDDDRVKAAYGAARYARLAAIKASYDPENVFHLNANIKPA